MENLQQPLINRTNIKTVPFIFLSDSFYPLNVNKKNPKNLNEGKKSFGFIKTKPHKAFINTERLYGQNFYKIQWNKYSLEKILNKNYFIIRNPKNLINNRNNRDTKPILLLNNFQLKQTFLGKIGEETNTKWRLKYKNKLTKIEFLETKKGNHYDIYIGILQSPINNNNSNNKSVYLNINKTIKEPLFIGKNNNYAIITSSGKKTLTQGWDSFFIYTDRSVKNIFDNYYLLFDNCILNYDENEVIRENKSNFYFLKCNNKETPIQIKDFDSYRNKIISIPSDYETTNNNK